MGLQIFCPHRRHLSLDAQVGGKMMSPKTLLLVYPFKLCEKGEVQPHDSSFSHAAFFSAGLV